MNTGLTLSEKRAAAGRKGGKRNVKRHGKRWMKKIARFGAHRMHSLYQMVPVGTNDFAYVHRETFEVKAYQSGLPVVPGTRIILEEVPAYEL